MSTASSEIDRRVESITRHRQQATATLQKLWTSGDLSKEDLPCSYSCSGYIQVETKQGSVRGGCPAHMEKGVCPLVEKADRERTARLSQAGFGKQYHTPDLSRIRARRAVEEFLSRSRELINQGHGMVITGDVGVGKTMMLAYMARSFIESGMGVWKVHMPEMVESIMDASQRRQTVERALGVQVLMLDDLGSGEVPEEVLGVLERIVEHRYGNHMPVFVSTNMTREQLVENIPLRRMVDRWRQKNMMVLIAGGSQRHE